MTKIIINGLEADVPADFTLIQACEQVGVEIPRFCYHERLSVAGNCRMCLVEVPGTPKPQASCALNVRDLRPGPDGAPPQVFTDSPLVHKARAGVMEMLLANHPLDCPICDQGGECDLQDQAMAYGNDRSRFTFEKRAVEDKDFGPLISTVMTRCIQCTRCVRFATEIAGVPELGAIGRGEDTEITPYLDGIVTSELSGNVIDLCPVGALTAKPHAFSARPWETEKTDGIDVTDALGSNIRIDSRGGAVVRIIPRRNDSVNEEWISDKARFHVDGLRRQRLDTPYVRGVDGVLRAATWEQALQAAATALHNAPAQRTAFIGGDSTDVETLFAYKQLAQALGDVACDARQRGEVFASNPAAYLFGAGIAAIDLADVIVLVGCNPRAEAAVLNSRIRAAYLRGASIAALGQVDDLTYPYTHLGVQPQALNTLARGEGEFAQTLRSAKQPLFIIGEQAYTRADALGILAGVRTVIDSLHGRDHAHNPLAVLQNHTGVVNAQAVGFTAPHSALQVWQNATQGAYDMLVLLAADELPLKRVQGLTIIYQGAHGDAGAAVADIILPATAYPEKAALYINTEGRVQQSLQAVPPPGQARDDRMIARALHGVLAQQHGIAAPAYNNYAQLLQQLYAAHPHVEAVGQRPNFALPTLESAPLHDLPLTAGTAHYYLSNAVCRASRTMAECARLKTNPSLQRAG